MADGRRPKDLWRGTAAAPGRPAPAKSGGGRRWLWAAVFLTALVGVIVALIAFLRSTPSPLFLGLAVTEYQDPNWPPNPWAGQDAAALRELFGPDSAQAFQSQERELILSELNQLATPAAIDSNRPVVVFLSANAVVRNGAVFLLPGNARPDQPATWLSLADVLEPLRRVGTARLLVLDLRPVASARLGLLETDLGTAIRDELKRTEAAGNLSFPVLTADPPGGNRVLRQGPFGLALKAGLQGRADAAPRDGLVSSDEWVRYARTATPRLREPLGQLAPSPSRFGPTADFRLLAAPTEGLPTLAEPTAADAVPESLLAAWQERDKWREAGIHRRAPRTFLHLETAAHRAETRLFAGLDPEAVKRELDGELRELKAQLAALPSPTIPAVSLALARRRGLTKQAEADPQIAPLLERIRDNPKVKPEELDPLRKPLVEKLTDREYAEAATAAILEAAAGIDRHSLQQLKLFAEVSSGFRSAPRFAETAVLRFLADADPKRVELWAPGTQRLILQVTREAERAAAFDPRCLPWVATELEAIDAIRRKAIADLVGGPRSDREAAPEKLLNAIRRYETVRIAAEALGRAFHEQDEIRAILRPLAEFIPVDAAAREEADRLWAGLLEESRQVKALLAVPVVPKVPEVSLLDQHANDLRVRREGMLGLFRRLRATGAGDPGQWLGWPGWSISDRKAIADQSAAYWLARSSEAIRAVPTTLGTDPADPPLDVGAAETRAIRSARRAVDLLALTDDPEGKKLADSLQTFEKSRTAENREALARLLRAAWAERLNDRYRTAKSDDERESIGWAIHPFDLGAIPRTGDTAPRDAAAIVRARQTTTYLRWLAEKHYQPDALVYAALSDPAVKVLGSELTALAFEVLAAAR